MNRRSFTVAALAILTSAASARAAQPALKRPTIAVAAPWQAPVPSAVTTAAGTRVVVLSDTRLPLVHVMVTIAAGSALDPPSRPGLAAAVESMLQDGGAGARTAPELAAALAELGAELRENVEPDEVQLELTVLSRNLERALALLGDLVARPRFEAAEWKRAQAQRLAEIDRRRDDRSDIADDVFQRVLYGDHPYAHMPLGSAAAISAITPDELRAFYQAHYGPKTVAFVVSGDATAPSVAASVTRALGDWKSSALPPPAPAPAVAPAPRVVIVDQPGAPQSELRVGHLGRARVTPDFPSLLLLRTILGGSFTSRLNQNLREKHGYSYGAQAHFDFWRAPGPFRAQAAVRPDVTAAALGEIVHELRAIQEPIGDAELQKGRALLDAAIVESYSDGEASCTVLADLVTHALPLDAWSGLTTALRTLDAATVSRVAAALFMPDRLVIVVVGDRKLIEPSLRALPFVRAVEFRDAAGRLVK